MNENTIGSRLALVRGQLSQAEFAQIIGIHRNSIGNYERGDREIGAGALATYVTLGWNANWLLTGEGPERIEAASKEMPSHCASEAEPLNGIKLELFAIAVELVDREVPRFGKSISAADRAEAYMLVYDMLIEDALPSNDVRDLRPKAELIAKAMMTGLLRKT